MSTILCVDDDLSTLSLLASLFKMQGFAVLATDDPRKAMDLAKNILFELAVVDYDLPHMSGTTLALELKRISPNLPIVLFSGTLSIAAEELTAVDEHVVKGETPDTLMLKTRFLLKPATGTRVRVHGT
jgi:DNA-binding response OmpR family regulator